MPQATLSEQAGNSGSFVGSSASFTTALAASHDLVLAPFMFRADDISHDYAGTVAGATEVDDGTCDGDNFHPGFWFGYAVDTDVVAGTWNHGNTWSSLAFGIDCGVARRLRRRASGCSARS